MAFPNFLNSRTGERLTLTLQQRLHSYGLLALDPVESGSEVEDAHEG
jgi:hypothetical protein